MWHLSKGVHSHEQLKHWTLSSPENLAIKTDQAWKKEHILNPGPITRYALTREENGDKNILQMIFSGKVFRVFTNLMTHKLSRLEIYKMFRGSDLPAL